MLFGSVAIRRRISTWPPFSENKTNSPDAEKALEVLKLKVDIRLVREVLKIDIEVNVKIQFFKRAGKRRNFQHDATTYMSLIHCLDEAGMVGELWKTIQDMVKRTSVISPAELSEIVKIFGRAKMVNKPLSGFYQVKDRRCRPNAATYNSVILMLMQEGHYEKVHEMCSEGNCCLTRLHVVHSYQPLQS